MSLGNRRLSSSSSGSQIIGFAILLSLAVSTSCGKTKMQIRDALAEIEEDDETTAEVVDFAAIPSSAALTVAMQPKSSGSAAHLSMAPMAQASAYIVAISSSASCGSPDTVVIESAQPKVALPQVPDGDYFVCAAVKLNDGTVHKAINSGEKMSFDRTPPAVTGLDTAVTVDKGEVTLNVTDKSAVTYVWNVNTSAGTALTIPTPHGAKLTLPTLKDGTHSVSVLISDAAGNSTEKTFTVTVVGQIAFAPGSTNLHVNAANQTHVGLGGTCSKTGAVVRVASGAAEATAPCEAGSFAVVIDLSGASPGDVSLIASYVIDGVASSTDEVTLTKDVAGPTLTKTSAQNHVNLQNVSAFTLSGTADEALSGASLAWTDASGVVHEQACTVSGQAWSAVIDFTAASNGSFNVVITGRDAAGNDATPLTVALQRDLVRPTPTFTASFTRTNAARVSVDLAFDEDVNDLALTDFTLNGATAHSLSGTGDAYTIELDPTAASFSIALAANAVIDTAGNGNAASNTLTLTYDTTKPTPTIATTVSSPTNLTSLPFTISFNETVTGFTSADLTLTGATLASFDAETDGTFSLTLAPTAATVSVAIAADVATDEAGNGNNAATTVSLTYDNAKPTVALSTTATSPTRATTLPITVTFNESVTGFVQGDVQVSGAAMGSVSGSGTTYTFSLTAPVAGDVTVDIAAGVATDTAGNTNTAATQLKIVYDPNLNVAPTIAHGSHTNVPWWWSLGDGTEAKPYYAYIYEDTNDATLTMAVADENVADTLTVTCTDLPAYATFTQATRTVSLAPLQTHVTDYDSDYGDIFYCEVSDGVLTSGKIYYEIWVEEVNDAPVWDALLADMTVEVGSNVTGTVQVSDIDDTVFYYRLGPATTCDTGSSTFAESLRINSLGSLVGTPSVSSIGTCIVEIIARDPDWEEISQQFNLTVTPSTSLVCDSGTLDDTCTIANPQALPPGDLIFGKGHLVIANGGALTMSAAGMLYLIMYQDVQLQTGGLIHANFDRFVGRRIEIQSGATLSAAGLGYASGAAQSGQGPAGGFGDIATAGGGGGHAGAGGDSATSGQGGTAIYDTALADLPFDYGSAGGGSAGTVGGHGGGKILLRATTLIVDGMIDLNGGDGDDTDDTSDLGAGGGAGGTLHMITRSLSGTGTMRANGGQGGTDIFPTAYHGGGGGGGAIFGRLFGTSVFAGTLQAVGGTGAQSGVDGIAALGPFCSPAQMAGSVTVGSSGSRIDPYTVCSLAQLDEMRTLVYSAFVLGLDIDAGDTVNWDGGAGFSPIGGSSTPFGGRLDGQGFTIDGLTINRPAANYVGLFGALGTGAVLTNLRVRNASISGSNYIGTICGTSAKVTLENISVHGTVTAAGGSVGGICGRVTGTLLPTASDPAALKALYADVNVISSTSTAGGVFGYMGYMVAQDLWSEGTVAPAAGMSVSNVGGLIGQTSGSYVYDSGSTASATGYQYVGGLVGYGSTSMVISGSLAEGNVTGGATQGYSAGLVGYMNSAVVQRSFALGSVQGGRVTGGLIGSVQSGSRVSDTYARGNVSAPYNQGTVIDINGGLIGHLYGAVMERGYATGAVVGGGEANGGILGASAAYTGDTAVIKDLFSTGTVTGPHSGAMIGYNDGRSGGLAAATNTYWDVTLSGRTVMCAYQLSGATGCVNTRGISNDSAYFYDPNNAPLSAWDFSASGVWRARATDYPLLAWQPDHRIFVTSTTHTGDLGGIEGADAICATRATAAALTGTWKALLSTTSRSAREQAKIRGPVFNMQGIRVARGKVDLLDGTLADELAYDESGNAVNTGNGVWTGSNASARTKGQTDTCQGFSSAINSEFGAHGDPTSLGSGFFAAGTTACDQQLHLYCISQ